MNPPASEMQGFGSYSGWLEAEYWSPALPGQIAALPGLLAAAAREAHGRSRLIRLSLKRAGQPVEVVVKAFARQPPWKDWADRVQGSKAQRSWRAARRLVERGVGTPPPVGYLDRWEKGRLVECYYFSEYVPDLVCLRDELIRLYRTDPDCEKLMSLLQVVADAIRGLHSAGLFHRDLGNQNILLRRLGDAGWGDVQFADLNRARLRESLTLRERARDISRITLPSDFLRVFIEMYFQAPPPRTFLRAERAFRRAFGRHTRSRRWRHPLRAAREARQPVIDATLYPAEPDIWIWDERSGQAISTMRPADRRRYLSVGDAVRTGGAVARAMAGGLVGHYRRRVAAAYGAPVELTDRFGLAMQPEPPSFEKEAGLLAALGPLPVLIRLYRHRGPDQWAFAAAAAREIRRRGHPLAVALVQDRRAILDPPCWDAFAEEALARVGDIAEWVEVGHAVNRVKWGLWRLKEYRALVEPIARRAADYPGVRWMGPAAIDFEYHRLAAFLREAPAGFRFNALSHHLYVDRRGAPENTQAGFDLEGKLALARALAQVSPACEDRLIISETNWPLLGTGVYSPVGSPYESPGPRFNDPSVTEEDYANFMIRYLVAAIGSGLAERVYWWRLVARGYGLVDDSDPAAWRPRPAYEALRTLLGLVGRGRFVRRRPSPKGTRILEFETADRATVALAWSFRGEQDVDLPFAFERKIEAGGREIGGREQRVRLTVGPTWFIGTR